MPQAPIGPYVIEKRLATGGMAEIFIAKRVGPHGFEKRVALKRILPQFSKDPDFVAMFIDEARLAGKLTHPNVVQVFDFGELAGQLFLAMELVEGTNVNRLLRAVSTRGEAVPLDLALHIASQTAHALDYAHRVRAPDGELLGFVHRDVSPANILLTHTGHVKLTDFGIATVQDRSRRTEDGHVRGKLGYMSPEQVLGKTLDAKSDVFTLTTVIAELLVAEPLFGTGGELDVLIRIRDVDLEILERTGRRIPQDVMGVLRNGLARKPEDRPTAGVFADACDEVIRRRGLGHGPERLARLLARLELAPDPPGGDTSGPGARVTSLLDTRLLSQDAQDIIGDVGTTSPAIYRVRLDDGTEVGPLSFPRLVQLVTSGRIHSGSAIAREGGSFGSALDYPELTRFVTSKALQWSTDEISRARATGRLAGASLIGVVYDIVVRQDTGVLHLWDGERRKKIYFVEGRPDFVASTDRSELLGEHLVAHDVCLRMEVEMALALLPRYGGRLGDALVGLGVLRPVELFRAIQEQVRARLLEAFCWRVGHWAFVEGEQSHEETFPLGYDTQELMRDAVLQVPPDVLEAAFDDVREYVLSPVEAPAMSLLSWRLPDEWTRVLALLQGDTTLASILARETSAGGLDAEELYRAIFLGMTCGLIRVE